MKTLNVFSSFAVDNTTKAKEFYTSLLGLELIDEKMGLRFRLPFGGEIFIYEKPNNLPTTFTILNIVVEDIDVAVDELSGRGIIFERYPEMPVEQDSKGIMRNVGEITGPSIAWFKDPAGNIIAVIQA